MRFPRWSPWLGLLAPIWVTPAAAAAQADPGPICADRPGKATGTCTVASSHFQFETGLADWSLSKDSGVRETLLTLGETVIKYGLGDRTELGVDITPYARTSVRAGGVKASASGFGDTTVLLKHRITADDAPLEIALLPAVKIPTAKHDFGNGEVEAALLVPVSYSIPHSNLTLGATPKVDWLADGDGHGHHAAMTQVVTLGWQATQRLTLSAELWGQWDWDPAGTTRQYSLDGSMAFAASNGVQLDLGANFGLNRNTPDLELYAGAAIRF